jgi:hypothetical protein
MTMEGPALFNWRGGIGDEVGYDDEDEDKDESDEGGWDNEVMNDSPNDSESSSYSPPRL